TETSRDGALFSSDGIWIEHGGLYVNVESLALGGGPTGVHMYDFGDDIRMDRYLHAQRAEVRSSDEWVLHQVVEKRYRADGAIDTRRAESLSWTPPWRRTTALYELPL